MSRSLMTGVLLLPLMGGAGCAPAPERMATDVRKASDVKITMGPAEEAEPEPAPTPSDAAPSGTAPSSAASTESASSESSTSSGEAMPGEQASATPAGEANTTPETASTESTTPAAESNYQGPAKFVGRVTVKGTVPILPPLVQEGQPVKDAICSKEAVLNQSVVASADGGLANVFVYLRRTPSGEIPAAGDAQPTLDQSGCVYVPHAQVLRIANPLHLKNSDPIAHNVRITGRAAGFNQTLPAHDEKGLDFEFRVPETLPAKVQCDFHGWMSAWILPVNHPWAVITDSEGRFEIPNLPEGELEFTVWHEAAGYVDRAYKITAQTNHVVEHHFEVDASKLTQ